MSEGGAKRVYEYVSLMHVVEGPEWDLDEVYLAYGHRPPRVVHHYYSEEKEGVGTHERTALIKLPEPLDENELDSWVDSRPDVLSVYHDYIDNLLEGDEPAEDADAAPEAEA